jgi:CubicO group peptidase (beta-lactamase class C family)
MRLPIAVLLALALALALGLGSPCFAGLPEAKPEAVGFDPARLARVEDAVARAIGEKKVPGAVVMVGRRGKVVLAKAFGRRAVEPSDEPMTQPRSWSCWSGASSAWAIGSWPISRN